MTLSIFTRSGPSNGGVDIRDVCCLDIKASETASTLLTSKFSTFLWQAVVRRYNVCRALYQKSILVLSHQVMEVV